MNFIVYDLEATCWLGRPPHGVNEVIEIGAFKLDRFGEELDRYNSFIRPTVNPILSPFCKRLTSINQGDVNSAPTFPKVNERFQDWINLDEEFILCSWGGFDEQLLRNDCNLHKLDIEWLENSINLKQQYSEIRKSVKKTGLKTSLKREGFEFTGVPHRAISDALNLCKIFRKFIDEWRI